jgi:hypothetical protein
MGSLERRIEALERRVGQPENPHAAAARERIVWSLDRIALLRVRQGVVANDLVLETEEDREAWAVFEALGERIGDGP